MIDKTSASLLEAVSQIKDGATVMIGGFGTAGQPAELIDGLIELGVKEWRLWLGQSVENRRCAQNDLFFPAPIRFMGV